MNFLKRQLAIVVMSAMGFIALSGYFVNWTALRDFTEKDAANFYMIIAGFAAFLGCLNLRIVSSILEEIKSLELQLE